ncbi:WD40/YVTN/BNR-like repeat-containing protein [Streptomyces sp. NPDC093225]|uniref:WD40/YVTN/BNR-like repeat-containing protein n=1 Tax=Streptomyces sp. NPDC093225 TaxID=3366034 RepID=UPI0037FE5858
MDRYGNSTGRSDGDAATTPLLDVSPRACAQGMPLDIRGRGWQSWPVRLTVDGRPVRCERVLVGLAVPDSGELGDDGATDAPQDPYDEPVRRPAARPGEAVRPDGTGTFLCRLSTLHLDPGEHRVAAAYAHRGAEYAQDGHEAAAPVAVLVRPRTDVGGGQAPPEGAEAESGSDGPREEGDAPFARDRFHWERRFGHLGRIPPGTRETQISQVRALRERRDRLEAGLRATTDPDRPDTVRSLPVPGGTNWTPMGPGPLVVGSVAWSGRALSIAVDPTDTDTVYLGTANGGVWKSTDRGLTWTPKSDFQRSLAIGALAVDPNDHLHVVAGTGEWGSSADTYYGGGLLISVDGGATWTERGTAVFDHDAITRVVFDPTDTTGQRLLVASDVGVHESTDGGVNWTRLVDGLYTDMVVFRMPGPPGTVKVVAGYFGQALWTSTRTSGAWSTWTAISSPALPSGVAAFERVAMAQQAGDPSTALALFVTYPGFAALARTTDSGATWSAVPMRFDSPVSSVTSSSAGHAHSFVVPATDTTAPPTARTYTSTTNGVPAHTHTVTFTAQEFARMAGGGPVRLTTTADATGHTHTASFSFLAMSFYAVHVAVHPTDPNILFVAERFLWRCSTGGGVFEPVPNVHADHHAFVFDPVTPTTCWDANDGGIQVSTDTGVTWSHRNRDLATLQFESIAQHPDWENVMIGGTQDNGVQRYAGTPAWTVSAYGDGGFTAIDPSTPLRMYQQYTNATIYRSEDAGASWQLKNAGIDGRVQFYSPFALDPTTPTTCYFGGDRLWRSEDRAETWAALTAAPHNAVTAIAVHPADSDTVYAGTEIGQVYRFRRTGPTWAPVDVTRTDLTGPSLPPVCVSDIAVDPAGVVWVTIAGLLNSEETGEFTCDHVYRRGPGDTVWTSRSGGLAQANPVNTIVIDPTNANRLFCGGDVGVFRTEDAGLTWFPWDQGLPNAPVFDLALHAKRRLLRAATHGRSVWERPVDATQARMVDLYVRDTVLDSGRVQPSPSGVVDPFDPKGVGTTWWWQSPDVLVDAPQPDYQTPAPVGDYVALTQIAHRTARRDRLNRFYVQVHNRGVSAATNVRVRAFLADASAGLPALPADFWSAGRPFAADPAATAYTPLGPTRTIARLEAAEPGVVEWDYLVPPTAAAHSCILAVTTCDEDPVDASQVFDVTTLVTTRKHAALKNLQVEDAVAGGVTPSSAFVVLLNNVKQTPHPFDVRFEWASLPEGTRLYIAFEKLGNAMGPQPGHGVDPLDHAERFLPETFTDHDGHVRKFDFARSYVMRPDEHRKNELKGVRIDPERGSRGLAVNVRLPQDAADRPVEFHVLQELQNQLLGGSTYVVRPVHPEDRPAAGAPPEEGSDDPTTD